MQLSEICIIALIAYLDGGLKINYIQTVHVMIHNRVSDDLTEKFGMLQELGVEKSSGSCVWRVVTSPKNNLSFIHFVFDLPYFLVCLQKFQILNRSVSVPKS